MPRRTVSHNIKARIPVLFYEQGRSIHDICDVLGIGKSLVYDTLKFHQLYGVPYNLLARSPGRPRSLTPTDLLFIRGLLDNRHCIYLNEIRDQLLTRRGIKVSMSTILRTLHRFHFSHKCISARALERNALIRSAYMNRIATIVLDPDMLMFADEAARDRRTSSRRKGWSPVGSRCVQRRYFVRGQRYSILPILTLDGIITYDIIPGSVTTAHFLKFLRELVVCVQLRLLHLLTYVRTDSSDQSIPWPSKCSSSG